MCPITCNSNRDPKYATCEITDGREGVRTLCTHMVIDENVDDF